MGYPRSFLGLLLTGFTLVALPLVGALAYSAWNTERLATQSRSAVYNAAQAARASRSLVDRISSIERVAQQMTIVEDAGLAVDYARVHRSFRQLADEIAQLPLDAAQMAALTRTMGEEQALYDMLTGQPRPRPGTKAVALTIAVLKITSTIRPRCTFSALVRRRSTSRSTMRLLMASTSRAESISWSMRAATALVPGRGRGWPVSMS